MWACGVAAAARAAARAPGLRLFVVGALGGVAGVWEARASGVWRRFSAEPEGERMRTSGLLGAGGGGAAFFLNKTTYAFFLKKRICETQTGKGIYAD